MDSLKSHYAQLPTCKQKHFTAKYPFNYWSLQKRFYDLQIVFQMPAVYTFNHSHSEILDALVEVFSIGRGTMREQWSTQAEILVEPLGWDALWKLSKRFCKKFGKIHYLLIYSYTVIKPLTIYLQ